MLQRHVPRGIRHPLYNGLGIQMDCPETLYLGIQRWWYIKNLYDCRGFRDHCRQCAERAVTYMKEYARAGYKVAAILSCDGSPACGVTVTSYDPNWGGSPVELSYNDAIVQGKGVYIEELEQAIKNRGLEVPPFYGLALDNESVDMDRIITDFRAFIQSICS